MPVPKKTNITHYRGDTLVIVVSLWNDVERTDPADLSEATIRAQVREQYEDTEVAASFDIEVTGNHITATLTPKSARDLPPRGVWDIEVDWYSDDVNVQTVAAGGIAAEPDVTREPVVA